MTTLAPPVSLRLALRELRGGLSGFRVLVACIALGVAAIAGINSVSRSLTEGITAQGRVILGGDLAFTLIQREATPEEFAFFSSRGEVGTIATTRAMVRTPDGAVQSLVELKGVDSSYPHGGTLLLDDGGTDAQARLASADGVHGALAAQDLMDRLGATVGDRIRLGSDEVEIRGMIRREPDRLSADIGFGPRMIVSIEAMRAAGLVRPGSLITWTYRIRMPDGANGIAEIGQLRGEADRRFPEAGWSKRSRDDAAGRLKRNIERFSQFLTLVGLTALVVGGVGVANAATSFVDLKRPAIATLKCLGASGRLVFRVYLIQILIIAALGIAAGLVVGAMLPFAARAALADLIPVDAVGVYPRELGLAVVYGLLVTLGFVLGPLGRARRMPAASLFADRAVHAPIGVPWPYRAAQAAALAGLGGLAVFLAGNRDLALLYVGAVVGAFVVLRLVAWGIAATARHARAVRGTALRLAVRNIHRPGALTPSVVLSLGLGLTLLVSLALIDVNLRRQLAGEIAERAPDFFFIDILGSEREGFVQLLAETVPGSAVEMVPMLRGRITAVDGTPVSELDTSRASRWVLRGDRGVTYSATVPSNSIVAAGAWWPPDHEGEPLVSLEAGAAEDLGLAVGDTITVNVLGRDIVARIAALRDVDWDSLSLNFVLVYSPNTLSAAPHASLATLRLPEGSGRAADGAVLAAVTAFYPGVTPISVRDAIDSVNAVIADLALGVRVAASLAIVISMLVLGGALAAGHRQRQQDAVILKTLGATRPVLLSAFSLEYGMLGVATALFAVVAGTGAAWYVVTDMMELGFAVYPSIAATAAATALAVTLGLGLAGTWRLLSVKPAPFLKNL